MNEDKVGWAKDQHQFPDGKDRINVLEFTRQLEEQAQKNGWETHHLSEVEGFKRPWFRLPPTRENAPCLYVSSGVHGDESAGPLACLKMLQETKGFNGCEVIMIPVLNPTGLNRGTRHTTQDFDINRDYSALDSPEIQGHTTMLKSLGRISAAVALHEDYEPYRDTQGRVHNGFYIFELKNNPSYAGCTDAIQKGMQSHIPRSYAPIIDGFEFTDGVKAKLGDTQLRKDIWMENDYLHNKLHTDFSYIIETPSSGEALPQQAKLKDANGNPVKAVTNDPQNPIKPAEFEAPKAITLEQRVNAHVAAVQALATNLPLIKPDSAARTRESIGLAKSGLVAGIDPAPVKKPELSQ